MIYFIISTYIIHDTFNSFMKHSCLTWRIINYSNEIIKYNKIYNLKVTLEMIFKIT